MDNKRKNIFEWKTKLSMPFVIIAVSGMLLFTIVFGIVVSVTLSDQMAFTTHARDIWRISFLVFILIQLIANVAILTIIFSTLHKTMGAFPRIERNLDKVLAGDYSVRIGLREKDNEELAAVVSRFNKILELLESKSK